MYKKQLTGLAATTVKSKSRRMFDNFWNWFVGKPKVYTNLLDKTNMQQTVIER